jgi:hypothetical protein
VAKTGTGGNLSLDQIRCHHVRSFEFSRRLTDESPLTWLCVITASSDVNFGSVAVPESNLQAFISYSRADWRFVENLAREFRCAGVATWVDIENMRPGDHWEPAIRGAIRSSRAFVFCISPLCVESGRTFRELETALSLGLEVFPVMIEPTPIDALPEALRRRHIVQLFRDPPSIACKRAAEQLARLLGLSLPENTAFASDHNTIDALILRIGDCGDAPSPKDFLNRDWNDNPVIVERAVTPLDGANFATITEWLNRCSAAYILIGEAAASDEIALVCGVAFAILGGRRLSFVCTPTSLPIASKFAHLVQARLIERCHEKASGEF